MISSAHRFHGRSSLRFVYQRGQTIRGGLLSLRYVRNERTSAYRVAVVVSRKVSKSAVVRNRIRRRLYEIVRLVAPQITRPHDLVFTVYGDEAAKLSHANLKTLAVSQLQKAGIIRDASVSGADHGTLESKER